MKVNTDDIKKHKNDVFRLLPLINPNVKILTDGNVRETVFLLLRIWAKKMLLMNSLQMGEQKKNHWTSLEDIFIKCLNSFKELMVLAHI